MPDDLGGGAVSGQAVLDLVIVAEEMGRLVGPGPFLATNVVAAALAESGSAEQRAEVLPDLAAGDAVASWAFAEPARGWRPRDVTLRAERSSTFFATTLLPDYERGRLQVLCNSMPEDKGQTLTATV